jgi:hypothetical protein
MNQAMFIVMNRHWASVICLIAVATFAVESAAQQTVPPEKVSGRQYCTVCHVSEQAAWEKSSHNTKAWALLDHPKAAGFAKALDVKDIKGDSACTQCHGTQQIKNKKFSVAHGNSCESCHGGSGGGADGWLKKHFDFGSGRKIAPGITIAVLLKDRAAETPQHRAAREQTCRAAGMIRSDDAFQIASNCLQCHLVPNEKLVDAGHPMSTRFEFVEWAQGEVRHNFLLDPKQNAEVPTAWSDRHAGGKPDGRKRLMYVAGQLADLTVSLRTRATVTSTKRNSLGDEANDRILDIHEELTEFEIPELMEMLTATGKHLDKRSLKDVTPKDKDLYREVADTVEASAKNFVAVHQDGSKLPANIKIPKRAKGDPHQP